MIANTVYTYCCEDVSLIENYEQAVNDTTQMWECHHKLGIEFSKEELIEMGLYWSRPASELIFVPAFEHRSMHRKNKPKSAETRNKMSVAKKGKPLSEKNIASICATKAKSVYQVDKTTGEFIKKWGSIREAGRTLHLNPSNIRGCCKGFCKSAGGFKWRYVD